MHSTIHKKRLENFVLLLEIDNPPANSLSKVMKQKFLALLEEIEQAENIRAIILTGRGNKFCTGDDLKEAMSRSTATSTLDNLKEFSKVIDRFEALAIPTIAAINGWCVGGGFELALCCDIRVAVPTANFITAGVNVGLTASGYRLPRLIGTGRAKRMLLTGDTVNAQQALQFGLITDIYEEENLLPEAIQLAELIASKAPLAVKATKKIANTALDLSKKEGYVLQQELLEELAVSEDYRAALSAFSKGEKPKFKGC